MTGYHLTKMDAPGHNHSPREVPVRKVLKQQGFLTHPLGSGTFVASRSGAKEPLLEELDKSTWLLQQPRGRGRDVVPIGDPKLRTSLVLDREAARADMGTIQKATGKFLVQEEVAWVLRKLGITCVLDVGANVGQFAAGLRRSGYQGRIVSFEPLSDLAERLRQRASEDPDWLVFGCALGEQEGTAEINARPGTMSSLLPSSEFGRGWSANLEDTQTETISVSRLDAVFDKATEGIDSPRVYLKMDTQGFDLPTFAGAGERVADILALQSEVACVPIYDGMPRLPEMLSVYEGAGFEIAGMYPVNIHRRTLRVIEFDMIMVRPEAAADVPAADPPAE